MWLVDPLMLCRRHLLGEHVETHMFVGTINKGKRLDGYIKNKLLDTRLLRDRHEALAQEMKRRGMKHSSPLPEFMVEDIGHIDVAVNVVELLRRCSVCRNRFHELLESRIVDAERLKSRK